MFSTNISNGDLFDRLDAGFYRPEYIELTHKLENMGAQALSALCTNIACGPFGGNAIADDLYAKDGVAFIRPLNISDNYYDSTQLVRAPKNVLHKNKLKVYDGKNLYFGRVGVPCVALIVGEASISPNIIIAQPSSSKVDSYYLYAFTASYYGLKQLQRQLKEVAQPTTSTEAVKGLKVLNPDPPAQKYIGDKVRQAERLRAWSKELDEEINNTFAPLTKDLKPQQTCWKAKADQLSPYRINPKQYDPVVLDMLQRAEDRGIQLIQLNSLLGERGVSGGATPKGAKYISEGTLFARVQNVKPLKLDLSDAVFLDKASDEELARSRCKTDDIILTITGYPGTASLVTDLDLPVNINQHSVRFDINPNYSAAYVCAALNSKFVKIQVNRAAIGGTREALDYPSVHNLLIPMLGEGTEQWVGLSVYQIIRARQLTNRLAQSAKYLVEALIEGKITEQELIDAETNPANNHGLLERLKTDGLDGQGEPLFPDIDQLEQLLKEAADD